jgi:SAM-dependent methyltransferase
MTTRHLRDHFMTGKPNSPICCLCAATRTTLLFSKDGYPVFRCDSCKAEFLHPQPSDDVLASIYGPDYFLGKGDVQGNERVAQLKAATAQRYLSSITGRLQTGRRKLLEIGCGTGDLLVQAQALGFDVRGVEFSPSSAAQANSRLGAALVETGSLETSESARRTFDVVIGCDVLEHVRNPQAFLKTVYECLNPGGVLFLITPSPESLSRKVLGRHWMEYKTEHLFYFSKTSLKRILETAGFQKVLLSSNRKVLSLDYLNDHFQRFRVPLCSWALDVARRIIPDKLAFMPFVIPASSVTVIAAKPGDDAAKGEAA